MEAAIDSSPDALWLADWRRAMGELYAAVRSLAARDPVAAWERWRSGRERLFREHPQSPVPPPDRPAFRARHYPYDPAWRLAATLAPGPPGPDRAAGPIALPSSGAAVPPMRRAGIVQLPTPLGLRPLSVFWLDEYSGGLFLPFRDATNGTTTYGAGRYLLDTAKGADLGGDPARAELVLDLNFAYQPSCAFDPRWTCPLAPPENRLPIAVEAGERIR